MLGIVGIRLKVRVRVRTPLKDEGRQKWGRGVIEMISNSQNDKACTLGSL